MKICERERCSGCSICSEVCPFGAVTMERDCEGFLRPVVDGEKCTECGLCKRKCPSNDSENNPPTEVCAAYCKDKDIRARSSSGGIFSCLAEKILEDGGVVIGAGYGEGLRVVHKTAENKDELLDLTGSKYVQSDTRGIYKKVGEYLKEKRTVLFSGTPCQCAAVRNLYGEAEGLYLCDFICHGVPTPELWKRFIGEEFTGAYGASFRDKKRGWQEFSMRVDAENGEYSCSQYKDPYLRMFLSNVCLRPSCYDCAQKGDNYSSDITLADFWGISKVFPEMNDDRGISVVIVRGEKGRGLFESVKDGIVYKACNVKSVARLNTAYGESAKRPETRESFFEALADNKSFRELSREFGKPIGNKEIIKIRMKRWAKKLIARIYGLKNR